MSLKLPGGRSFFVNEYAAREDRVGGRADRRYNRLAGFPGQRVHNQKSAFIASSPTVKLGVEWQGFAKGFWLKAC
ncbi:TPA: hypothetical protein EYP26_03130 [Candidatus Bathyarchaeota archaeon]|nr:hypothetical protein [Candidatus Bathyarchaeota archaeon]